MNSAKREQSGYVLIWVLLLLVQLSFLQAQIQKQWVSRQVFSLHMIEAQNAIDEVENLLTLCEKKIRSLYQSILLQSLSLNEFAIVEKLMSQLDMIDDIQLFHQNLFKIDSSNNLTENCYYFFEEELSKEVNKNSLNLKVIFSVYAPQKTKNISFLDRPVLGMLRSRYLLDIENPSKDQRLSHIYFYPE